MPSSDSKTTQPQTALRNFIIALLVLGAVLSILFHNSFVRDLIVFSNDGPLGALSAKSGELPSGFTGVWQDLNWVGIKGISAPPNLTSLIGMSVGPYYLAKFHTPIALLFLGLCAWFFFRQLRFHPAVCVLGGLAAALNMNVFSHACWGLPSRALTLGGIFLALGALQSATVSRSWIKIFLAGWAVGLGIMEGFDVGAIFSLYVAAFAFFLVVTQPGSTAQRITKGALWVAIVALSAAFFATQVLSSLIGTQIQGVAEMKQDVATKNERWDAATMWSLPKIETLRVIIPGLFGYRMEPPDESNYWGSVGQSPGIPQTRHSGSGEYAGVLVVLVALWGLYRSVQKKDSPFSERERKFIWFWGAATLLSLFFAFGRHAPFYHIIYKLPYFSTIRNPIKFMHPFHLGLLVLFGYGLQGLFRHYLEKNLLKSGSLITQVKTWWATAAPLDRKWTIGSLAFAGLSVLGWLLYSSSRRELERHLQGAGFTNAAAAMAKFSLGEVGLFVVFAALSVGLLIVIMSGGLSGPRAKLAWISIGVLLAVDLGRANTPWIIYWNVQEKYASNPIIDFLRKNSDHQRVTERFMPLSRAFLVGEQPTIVSVLYEWLQHHFQYYNVQSLDIIQMPRRLEMDEAYMNALAPKSNTNFMPIARLWQLTSTRYLLGPKGSLDQLNQQIDPGQARFRVHTTFEFMPRPPLTNFTKIEDFAVVTHPAGQFALLEFTGALPRAKLYSHWQISTNDQTTLSRLSDEFFNPSQTVLVSNAASLPNSRPISTNQNSGAISITDYAPKRIQLKSQASTPTVLLLNDKYDPDWKVKVDGKEETLLRCNFIMRGVSLPAGEHTIEFRFEPPLTGLYISLAAIAIGLVFCGILVIPPRPSEASAPITATHHSKTPSK